MCREYGQPGLVLGLTTPLFAGAVIRGLQTLNHYLRRSHELTYDLEDNVRLLERSEEMRRDLTLMLVHDLRTPLTGLITHARMARDCTLQDNREDSLEELQYTVELAQSVTTMINSILDVNRLESDEFPLSLSTVPIGTLIESALQTLGSVEEEIRVEGTTKAEISCDAELISRVIVNLLGNAVRYQPDEEPIRVVVHPQKGALELRFIDKGPGVPKQDQERIFDKYVQSQATSRAYSYGLGLTFCKLAVERHGGTIGVESELGQGSEFWFRLPTSNED
ncbi:MAG: HAMP domain-containing histidine kinase [Candidatus Eremiobacteraeota bacterium]|nr:HAMP domain-containing histidine kinase [Candidatus Eremiobacteraeota bacterium]